jgi:hypothetical protein
MDQVAMATKLDPPFPARLGMTRGAFHLSPPSGGVPTYAKLTAGLIRISRELCGRAATEVAPWAGSTTAAGWPAILPRKIPYHR